jgi:hypothetical protein
MLWIGRVLATLVLVELSLEQTRLDYAPCWPNSLFISPAT